VRSGLGILPDLRFALKSLRRSPGFSFVAILTLGLGIGANTSMFSAFNAYMLRPAPYPDSDRVDRFYRATSQDPRGPVPPADYLDLKADTKAYGEIAAYAPTELSVAEPGKPPEYAEGLRVTANLFALLRTRPLIGRAFRPDEEVIGNQHVLIINHHYWQNHFGGAADIIGRTVRVDGEPYEIVGVLPPDFSDFRHLSWVDVFRPLALDDKERRDRSTPLIRLIGRRSPEVTGAQAAAFIAGFGSRLARDFPTDEVGTSWRALPLSESFLPPEGESVLLMLVGLSGFVLLIACSNLANLLLARTMARARELAVRSALGASRAQMLRPLFVESLLLAFAGGGVAILVAMWMFDWLEVVSQGDNGVGVALALDWRILAWAFVACLFTALAFGVGPALFAGRLDLNKALKSGSRGTIGDRGHRRFRSVLIVGQLALAMILLAGAALFTNGLHDLNNRRYGWESDRLVTGTLTLRDSAYPGDREIRDFGRLALERLEALPGVASASASYAMPFFGLSESRKYLLAGREVPEPGHEPAAVINGVSPHYFETVGTRLLSGRVFDEHDTAGSPRVFVINDAMARGLFPGENPIGRRIAQAGGAAAEWGEIVGVVADVESVYPDRLALTQYQLYQPMMQEPRPLIELAVRTSGSAPATLIADIRTALMALDADLPVRKLQPAAISITRANYQQGVLASMLTGLAVLGLGLASLGVYGVIARTVAQRTGEFGIRLALGAQARDITRLVLASGAKLAVVGTALGLLGGIGVSRLLAAAFPGIHTSSPAILIGATVLLFAIAQVAGYIPARRAARISPTEALRAE